MSEWLQENYKWVVGVLSGGIASGFGIKYLLDYIVKKHDAERSSLQVSDNLLKEWMAAANDGAKALMAAHRKLLLSEDCLRDCLRIMERCGADPEEVAAIEARINKIHE